MTLLLRSLCAVLGLLAIVGHALAAEALQWSTLPALPDKHGFAAPFAGVSGDALIVAGGANFPDGYPWDGGKKVFHDRIFVLSAPDGSWQVSETRLPAPVGYGVSVTLSAPSGATLARAVTALVWPFNSLPAVAAPLAASGSFQRRIRLSAPPVAICLPAETHATEVTSEGVGTSANTR